MNRILLFFDASSYPLMMAHKIVQPLQCFFNSIIFIFDPFLLHNLTVQLHARIVKRKMEAVIVPQEMSKASSYYYIMDDDEEDGTTANK